jgi:2,3-bisphosphoglycerate-independent phosphoglycerate mutase
MSYKKKVILVVMDGWGVGKEDKFNAIYNAKTPNVDRLVREYPNIQLKSDGLSVGLPEGQFGTSEINHQVLGSGRVVFQDLPRIDQEIKQGSFFTNKELVEACEYTKTNKSALHLVGILSDGNVHAALNHVLALIDLAKQQGVAKLYLHIFTDGRDTPPKSAEKYLKALDEKLKGTEYKIATLQGRFYLDRDRDWAKTEIALNLIVNGKGMTVNDWQAAVNFSYNQNTTDEYFEQFVLDKEGLVKKNDSVLFFHYRSDRMYQIYKALFERSIPNLKITTFIEYSEEFKAGIAFPRPAITNTLAETLSHEGKKQYHISETEKYTHLTFFFNGGKESEFPGEVWKRYTSNRFVKPYYSFEPSMRAFEITKDVIAKIKSNKYDLILINYPNTDMVGHTGNYNAAVIAAEAVDYCVGKLYDAIKNKLDKWTLLITADHGNADQMWDYENNQPHTQHTLNPVPFIVVSDIKCRLHPRESLEDVAPTILELMGIAKPELMTGSSLIDPLEN